MMPGTQHSIKVSHKWQQKSQGWQYYYCLIAYSQAHFGQPISTSGIYSYVCIISNSKSLFRLPVLSFRICLAQLCSFIRIDHSTNLPLLMVVHELHLVSQHYYYHWYYPSCLSLESQILNPATTSSQSLHLTIEKWLQRQL